MSKMILSLLPTQYDSLDDLYKRRNALLAGEAIDGLVVNPSSPEAQMVINALNKAIDKRKDRPQKFAFKGAKVDRSYCGKTERDKAKDNYKNPVDKKKAKSDDSRKIRSDMQTNKKK